MNGIAMAFLFAGVMVLYLIALVLTDIRRSLRRIARAIENKEIGTGSDNRLNF